MKRPLLLMLIVALITLGAGFAVTAIRPSATSKLATAVVERGAFIDYLPVRGEIRPERSIVLTAPSAGGGDMQIIQLVANGAQVRKGDTIAVFDATNHQRTLEQKTSELKQAESELARAQTEQQRRVRAVEAELQQARSTVARHRLDLDAAELLSKVDAEKRTITVANADRLVNELVEKLAAEREIAAADVAIARQKVDKMRYDVQDTERIIASLSLTAPRDGMVSLLPNFRAGGPMSRTSPEFRRGDRAWSGAGIAELPDLSTVRMTLRVDEADRARLVAGGTARIRVDALPDREFAAQVSEISLVATPDFTSFPPVRNFDVGVTLSESDARLRAGMSATARIELDRIDDALIVPATALIERDGRSYIVVVSGGSIEERPVNVIRRSRERVALADGVREGDAIAIEPLAATGGAS
jgi:multidrug efflux pump subunit AcrA (membrane-fusion protein)